MSFHVVILAAGQGTRMRSRLPKVLHPLAGTPLLTHVVNTAQTLNPSKIHVVYGHGGEHVRTALSALPVNWIEQAQQLGTGHAVVQAMSHVSDDAEVLVLYGDVPLIQPNTLRRLLNVTNGKSMALLTAHLDEPFGYGRIIRDVSGNVIRIVEQKDASSEESNVNEINTGILAAHNGDLQRWLGRLDNQNVQQEYYLTDVIAMAAEEGMAINTTEPTSIEEILGVNNRVQLAQLERYYQKKQAERFLLEGVTLLDPARFDVRGHLDVGPDTVIDINTVFEGTVKIGSGVKIGPNTFIKNVTIGDDVEILANCVIEDAEIGAGCRVGPFARLRPQTTLAENVHVGNFVEIKKSDVAQGSKINHLSYVGDSTVGRDVNIGAGTITCNYDGAYKHKTVIGDRVFVGSDTQLVAPVRVGAGATIGAGTTVTKDVPEDVLVISRVPQRISTSWNRPKKTGERNDG